MPVTKEFKKVIGRVKRDYLGKPVETRLIKKYGKIYNKKDILSKAYAIAKRRGIQIEK